MRVRVRVRLELRQQLRQVRVRETGESKCFGDGIERISVFGYDYDGERPSL